MLKLRDLTIHIRPIALEWYLERFTTILHNIVSSRLRLREIASTSPERVIGLVLGSLPNQGLNLRVVFIIKKFVAFDDMIRDNIHTALHVDWRKEFKPYACIDHCKAAIREKLQDFVVPVASRPASGVPSQARWEGLDLSFDVLQERDMYCGDVDDFDAPPDRRFVDTGYRRQPW